MFTHLNVLEATSFTTGEILSGASSGATGVVQSISAKKSAAVTSISVASPGVVTLNAHGFVDGQQINVTGGNFQIIHLLILKEHIQLETQQLIHLNYLAQTEQHLKM